MSPRDPATPDAPPAPAETAVVSGASTPGASALRHLRRPDLGWRALLVVAAVVCALDGAPQLVTGILALLSLVAVVERLARWRRLGGLDALLVSVGGAVAALVLIGLVLGTTPLGLGSRQWSLALGVAGIAGLVVAGLRPAPSRPTIRRGAAKATARTLPWVLASLLVVGIAVSMSERSVVATSTSPVQLSLGSVDGTKVEVVVTASETTGPLELRTAIEGNEISYPLFTVEPGKATTTTLAVPATGRFTITLNNPDQTQPLRTLTLDR